MGAGTKTRAKPKMEMMAVGSMEEAERMDSERMEEGNQVKALARSVRWTGAC